MTCHFSAGNKLNNNKATINKITICLLINKREILISELNTCVYQYFICWAWMKNYDMDCYCNFFLSILHQRRYHPNCTKVCTCRVLGNLLHFMLRGSLKKPWVNMTRKHPPQVWSNYIPRKSSVKKHSPLIDGSIYTCILMLLTMFKILWIFKFQGNGFLHIDLPYMKLELF